jgi:uncharacterized protein GlcG (DUF336 family)
MIIRKLCVALLSAATAVTVTTVRAASTYDGDGQVPQQFAISGKAAEDSTTTSPSMPTLRRNWRRPAKPSPGRTTARSWWSWSIPGLVVHEHRMDGEGWIQVNATEQKARTALRTRAPSHVLTNRNVQDPFTNQNMAGYGLTTQEGGLPIIVNGQLIGAIGVGGIPPAERNSTYGEEMCARDALEAVIGPQPPLLPDLAAQRNNNPGGPRGTGTGTGTGNR